MGEVSFLCGQGGPSSQYPFLLGMEPQVGVDWRSPQPQHQLLPSPGSLPVPARLPPSGKRGHYGSGDNTESYTLRIRPHLVTCLHEASFTGPEQREQDISDSPCQGHDVGGGRTQGGSHQRVCTIESPMPRAPGHGPQLGRGLHWSQCALVPVVTEWPPQVRDVGCTPALSRILAVSGLKNLRRGRSGFPDWA